MAVATVEFQEAAVAQYTAQGFQPALVWVPHPIQNRTPQELAAIADAAIDGVLAALTRSTKT